MSENWRHSEICIVIDDESQDSTAKHLSYDGLLHCKLITHFAGERIFKICEQFWRSYRQNGSSCHTPIALRLLSSKMQKSLDN